MCWGLSRVLSSTNTQASEGTRKGGGERLPPTRTRVFGQKKAWRDEYISVQDRQMSAMLNVSQGSWTLPSATSAI